MQILRSKIKVALRDESGQSVVEFGLIVPLLCGLILALADVGFGVNDAIDATHLANQGSRLAAVNASPPGGGTLSAYIQSQAESKDIKAATVTICLPTGSTGRIGDAVKVIVNGHFTIVPFIGSASFPIKGTSTMRLEQKPTTYSPVACP